MTMTWHENTSQAVRGFILRALWIGVLLIAFAGGSGFASAKEKAPDIRGTWEAHSEVHMEGEGIPFVVEQTHDGVKLVITDMEEHTFRGFFDFQLSVEGQPENEIIHFVGFFEDDDDFVLGTKLGTIVFGEVDGDKMSIDYLSFNSTHSAGTYEMRRAKE